MKHLLIILIIITFTACNNNNEILEVQNLNAEGNPIVGRWQLVEERYSAGFEEQYVATVTGGYFYIFKDDGTFESNRKIRKYNEAKGHYETDQFEDCNGGIYLIKDNLLTLNFTCKSGNPEYIEAFEIVDGDLYLSMRKPTMCIEGCSSKYKKVN